MTYHVTDLGCNSFKLLKGRLEGGEIALVILKFLNIYKNIVAWDGNLSHRNSSNIVVLTD